jgi:SAM-dependent methyltransferase
VICSAAVVQQAFTPQRVSSTTAIRFANRPTLVITAMINSTAAPVRRVRPFRDDFLSPMLDPLSLKFAIYARAVGRETLDIGCGGGLATAAALARGGYVLAVDPEPRMIERVRLHVPSAQHPRLHTELGALPHIDFAPHRFAAVHAAYVLPLLDGGEIERSLCKMREWLQPEGKMFLSTFAPEGRRWGAFHPTFKARCSAGRAWPGEISDVAPLLAEVREVGSGPFHLLDVHTLSAAVARAGFTIEEVQSYAPPWDAAEVCCGLVASSCGKTARWGFQPA